MDGRKYKMGRRQKGKRGRKTKWKGGERVKKRGRTKKTGKEDGENAIGWERERKKKDAKSHARKRQDEDIREKISGQANHLTRPPFPRTIFSLTAYDTLFPSDLSPRETLCHF